MSDNPTSGEWTVAYDIMVYAGDPRDSNNFLAIIRDDEGRNRIVETHNAALAAERYERLCDQKNHKRELAAEREKVRPMIFDPEHYPEDRITELEQQLAAEREKAEQECDLHLAAIEEARQLREQLDDEQEKRKVGDAPCPTSQSSSTNTDATPLGSNAAPTSDPEVRQLREQLAAEKERAERYRLDTLKLEAQLAADREQTELAKALAAKFYDELKAEREVGHNTAVALAQQITKLEDQLAAEKKTVKEYDDYIKELDEIAEEREKKEGKSVRE